MSWNQGNYIIKSEEVKVKGKVKRKVVIGFLRRSESKVIAYGLHYQALASQDGSEVVRGGIAVRIFFKFLQSESVRTRPECDLVKP
jgi:hypothetical protein